MRILVDLDATVVNMHDRWYREFNRETNDDLTVEKVLSWDTHLYIREPKYTKLLYEIICRKGFYEGLPPLRGAVHGVHSLYYAGHDVRFCSATPSAHGAREKMDWVDLHFRELGDAHKVLILTHEKHLQCGDVLVDDSPRNLRAWPRSATRLAMTIAWPWNAGVDSELGVHRFEGWRDTAAAWREIVRAVGVAP